MDKPLHAKIADAARYCYSCHDVGHDFLHAQRVTANAVKIWEMEGRDADLDVIVAAAYLHDATKYRKSARNSQESAQHSAELANVILHGIPEFPQDKIPQVCKAVEQHSYSGHEKPETFEAAILQDADRLDELGAAGLMRHFAWTGHMAVELYDAEDPFCENRTPDPRHIAIDFIKERPLKIMDRLHTASARKLAGPLVKFTNNFLKQAQSEIDISVLNKLIP